MITLTEKAAQRVKTLIQADGRPDLMFRVSVNAGGCSGFSYNFALDDGFILDHPFWIQHDLVVVTDPDSFDFVTGSTVDYVDDILGAKFVVKNPAATATCGCGNSFGV